MTDESSFFLITYVLLWILVLGESVMLFVLLRQVGHIYLSELPISARQGIAIGKHLPDIPTRTPDGERPLRSLLGEAPYTAVVIVTPTCPICHGAVEALRETLGELPWLGATVLVEGEDFGTYSTVAGWGSVGIVTAKAAGQLQVRGTPFVFIVDNAASVVAKGVVNTQEDLLTLLRPAHQQIDTLLEDELNVS